MFALVQLSVISNVIN